ncbi:exodeoxyribonuclease VII small subunit [Crassaminicella thermophila]|uniref:Exodeoxyribonuclease 7 small subunit n=1 Tax=Crassaminicella thermophila TaxID=2599308 RepID=A0A5C0SGB0_CRATE|nr:exodeoxyribonuclease VII small subunit [Crassaminicella thermophila]
MNLKLQSNDSFEVAIKKLEEIVMLLDEGKLTLDETLTLYEEGIRIYRYCNRKLDNAEQKISLMMNENKVPFDFAESDDFKGE